MRPAYDVTGGLGLRDHSWGPRSWQSIWWYRWINASFGSLGFAFTVRGEPDPDVRHVKGHLYDVERYGDAQWVPIRDVVLASTYDEALFPVTATLVITTDDATYEMHGEVLNDIPLRHRSKGAVTRLTETLTRWTCGERVGAGLSEHLDQVIDGVVVGQAAGV